MAEIDLVVVGGGVFQRDREGRLCAKSPVTLYVEQLARWFGGTVWASMAAGGASFFKTSLDGRGFRPSILIGKGWGLLRDYHALRRLVSERTALLVFLPQPWLTPVVLAIRKRARGLFVYVGSDYLSYAPAHLSGPAGRLKSRVYCKLHDLQVTVADGVIARGETIERRARMLNKNVLQTAPIGHASEPLSRTRQPCDGAEVRLLFVGKVVGGKGLNLLLRALAELRGTLLERSLHLTVVGDGPALPEVKALGTALGLGGVVDYCGYVDDPRRIAQLYGTADLLVVPSYRYAEGVPRVIDEAIASGLPVVASAIGGIPGEFLQGEIALVPPGEIAPLAAAIRRVVTDADYRCSLLEAAWRRAARLANLPHPGDQHAQFILGTLRDSGKL